MTITRYDGYSVLPKRCNVCGRLFVLEPYNEYYIFEPNNEYYIEVGFEHYSLKQIKCFECIQKYNERKGGDE